MATKNLVIQRGVDVADELINAIEDSYKYEHFSKINASSGAKNSAVGLQNVRSASSSGTVLQRPLPTSVSGNIGPKQGATQNQLYRALYKANTETILDGVNLDFPKSMGELATEVKKSNTSGESPTHKSPPSPASQAKLGPAKQVSASPIADMIKSISLDLTSASESKSFSSVSAGSIASKVLGALELLLHSSELNSNEEEELNKRAKYGPTKFVPE